MNEMEEEKRKQDVLEMSFPNVKAEEGANAAGRFCLLPRRGGIGCRLGGKRGGVILHRFNVEDVITAHRCAECSDHKYDLITAGEGYIFQDVACNEGGEHVGNCECDVARTCHSRPEAIRDGFSEECVEANAKRCERDSHKEGEDDKRPDLSLFIEEPGQGNKKKIADAKDDR